MADDKQIRIGVDASQAQGFEQKMRQSAANLARDMIKDARAYTTSAKEVTAVLNEQIAAIEKRNKLDREFREKGVKSKFERGAIPEEAYKKQMSGIASESREDKLQTQLLKEIIDAIKTTSRQEIREDRISVEKRIQSSKTVDQLNPKIDPEAAYKETLQQEYLQSLKDKEVEQRGGMDWRRGMMMPANMLGTQNAAQMASQALTGGGAALQGMKGGLIAGGLAMLIGKAISELSGGVSDVEGAAGDYSRLTGRSAKGGDLSKLVDNLFKKNISKAGMKPSDWIRERAAFETGGMTSDFGESSGRLSFLTRGTMLNEQQVSGLVGLRRFGSGTTATGTSEFFKSFLEKTGQSMAVLPEIIQQFTQESRAMISQTGEVNTRNIAQILSGIGGQAGLQGEALGGAVGAVRQGLMRSSNPVIQAMQFKAARQAAGSGASLWDVEKIMANPFENMDYVKNVLGDLRQTTGGGQKYERAISNMFGVNPVMAERLAKWKPGTSLPTDIMGDSVSFYGEAVSSTGVMAESTAKFGGFKEKMGTASVAKLVEKLNEGFDELIKLMNEGLGRKEGDTRMIQAKTVYLETGDLRPFQKLAEERHTEQRGVDPMQERYWDKMLLAPNGTQGNKIHVVVAPE